MTKRIEHKFENNVETKHCGKCKNYVDIIFFGYSKSTWDNLRPTCKKCLKQINFNNKERITEYNKKYWEKTKEQQSQKNKEWRNNNKEHVKKTMKEWYEKNKEYVKQKDKEYKLKNIEYYRKIHREYTKKKYHQLKNDPTKIKIWSEYKIKSNISRRIREILIQKNSNTTHKYIGCSLEKFRIHLENTMTDGMNWLNYGQQKNGNKKFVWHIDHIIPCSAFDLNNPIEQLAFSHYKNLRACWWYINIKKSNFYKKEEKERYMKNFIEMYIIP